MYLDDRHDAGLRRAMTVRRPLAVAALLTAATVLPALAATPVEKCEAAAAATLGACVKRAGGRVRACYADTGAPCAATDRRVAGALAELEQKVLGKCPDAATVQAAGYGAAATPAGLVARLKESCAGDPATLAARTFGGPQGALLVGATSDTRACLDAAMREATKLVKTTLEVDSGCIRKAHRGRACNVASTAAKVAAAEAKASTGIGAACADLKSVIGLDVAAFLARAGAQARCMTATAHGDTGPLTLDCGPRAAVTVPPRGTWVQVVLDEATWGTRCGNGSPYAFWLRLAPEGSPVERVAVDLQGGGVCIFESDCDGVNPGLFTATDDGQPSTGYMSTDPSINPFSDWTMIFLPYCTQDVHIGGGLQSVFPSITVNRYGGVNVRAALRYLRDALWPTLDATSAEGYRPDRLTVLFGGESAGAFGVSYNYHHLLDDLRWIHTTAAPDAGLGLDNGGPVSVRALGGLIGTEENPYGWGTLALQPPYCLSGECAVVNELQAVTSVRLKAVPDQQILNISNQVDTTQVSTTFFRTVRGWINKVRTTYCANKGKTGLRYWLSAQTASFHTILRTNARFTTVTAGGVTVRDWLADAIADPDGVVDRVDEGTLVTDYPGTNPIPCSPGGAFLD
jgi:hypothetical protein